MLPTLVDAPPDGEQWLHEIKYDGYRTQIRVAGGRARAFTRAGHDWSTSYAPLVEAAAALTAGEAVLDGEVIVQDAQGRPDFTALKGAIAGAPERLVFVAFDLLDEDGRDLRTRPLEERRARLEDLVAGAGGPIQFSAHVEGGGAAFFAAAEGLGLEGIVSKKKGSRYRGGYSRAWLKAKTFAEDEFAVVAVERGDLAPIAFLAREGEAGLELAGPAMVTLAGEARERFWEAVERLKSDVAAVPMPKRRQGSFVDPGLRVRARFLRGETPLRHATVQAILAEGPAPPSGRLVPRPIPGTARGPAGEPSYTRPRLPPKPEMLAYYMRMAPLVLEHAGARPLNLFRCTAGHCFFQRNRNHPGTKGEFAAPIRFLPLAQKNGRTEEYLWVDDAAGLMACIEADGIELHGWGSRVADVEKPDRIALDLDPGEGVGFEAVKAAATTLRAALAGIGLASFPLLSGGKGVHVVVPLTPDAEWPEVREFARRVCAALADADPARYTVSLPKAERKGRIFLDWLRNQRTATAILPYSLRARAGAPVAAPVTWDELPDIPRSARYTIHDAALLATRARSRALRGWGKADQRLPRIG